MLDSLMQNIIYGHTYCSLEHTGTDSLPIITILISKKHKGELTIVDKASASTIKNVRASHTKLKYAHLIINNNQVLQRTIENVNSLSDDALLNQTFSDIDVTVFLL